MKSTKLKIIPTDCPGLNCFDGLVISVAEWLHRDYEISFAEAWNFGFAKETEEYPQTIGDRLYSPNVISYEILRNICGIEIKYNDITDINEFLSILKQNLSQQCPIIIIHDLFWCNWDENHFQKIHAPEHSSLVIGYSDSGLNCIDYSPKCEECILPYEYLDKSIKGFYTMNIKQPTIEDNINWHEIINKSISVIYNYDTFSTIRKFGTYIKESFDPVKEVERYGVENFHLNPLNLQIARIPATRSLFAANLKYLYKIHRIEQLLLLAEKIELAKPMWTIIMSLIVKSCINSDIGLLEKISKKIYDVADYEESIFRDLESINRNAFYEIGLIDDTSFNIQHINLSKYLNNRAFESDQNSIILPDFTGDGSFILKDTSICRENIGVIGNSCMKFKLTNILEDSYDNILCKGQTIEIGISRYKRIMILGCSTLGNYLGDIKINYTNGSFEIIRIEVSDCYPHNASFEHQIIWSGYCSTNYIKLTRDFECQLYAQSYDINCFNDIKSLTLPFCPNIHIFAISLES